MLGRDAVIEWISCCHHCGMDLGKPCCHTCYCGWPLLKSADLEKVSYIYLAIVKYVESIVYGSESFGILVVIKVFRSRTD